MSADPSNKARGPMRRVVGLTAAIAVIVALAFLVARPGADPDPVAVKLAAQKGPRPPGLKIFLQRATDVQMQVLDPAMDLRAGDALRLVVRASAPRYLVVRVRDGAGRERVVFPPAGAGTTMAAQVKPDDTLPGLVAIDDTSGKTTLTALFGKQPFAIDDRAAARDLEIATVELHKAP